MLCVVACVLFAVQMIYFYDNEAVHSISVVLFCLAYALIIVIQAEGFYKLHKVGM